MTDDDAPELTSEQEAEVSRLLAGAGGPVRTPPEVERRLEDVLAGLVAEREPRPAAERTSRRWPRVLLAAAAVLIGGYGIGNVVGSSPSGDDSGAASDSATAGEDHAGGARQQSAAPETAGRLPVLRLHSGRLESGVERVLRLPRTLHGDDARVHSRADPGNGCRPPSPSPTWYAVRFDGRPAALVTGPVRQGQVRARIWSCGGTLLAETSVPAP